MAKGDSVTRSLFCPSVTRGAAQQTFFRPPGDRMSQQYWAVWKLLGVTALGVFAGPLPQGVPPFPAFIFFLKLHKTIKTKDDTWEAAIQLWKPSSRLGQRDHKMCFFATVDLSLFTWCLLSNFLPWNLCSPQADWGFMMYSSPIPP